MFRWKAQVLIDAGVREGIPSVEADELAAANKRIAALEAELKLTRDACELFDAQAVVSPKGESRSTRADRARTFRAVHLPCCWCTQIHISATAAAAAVHQNNSQNRGRGRDIPHSYPVSRHLGKRRIKAALLAECKIIVNHKLVASIMAEPGLFGLPRRKRRGHPMLKVSTPTDLVNRAFTAARPNQLWCTDITEHPARDGKVYCCAILDCFSKKIVGRAFSTVADTALVNNAVNMAVLERTTSTGLILHADHGTQFTSWSFGENLRRHRLLPSFGTVGDCFDNCSDGIVLGADADRTPQYQEMADNVGIDDREGRLDRQLLQRRAPALLPRPPQPQRVRDAVARHPTKPSTLVSPDRQVGARSPGPKLWSQVRIP
ncbi:IS3 family transposase [Nocardia sp. CA-135398]|uniref:IS3 family transposase n=1 Tax=Nocardia sp. CA-135398 TaxID=3239977 RepID=UPI003D95A19C